MPAHSPSITLPANGWASGRKFYLSPKGLKRTKQEYESFKKLRFLKTNKGIPNVLESEDLNPEYLSIQEDLSFLEVRIAEMEHILKNVKLIKSPVKEKQDVIDLGAKVKVKVQEQKQSFEIVGSLEADPVLGKISNDSPVGKALLGHRVGDEVVVVSSPKTIYKIRKIKY